MHPAQTQLEVTIELDEPQDIRRMMEAEAKGRLL